MAEQRLIDADALMERLKMHCYIVQYDHGCTSKDYGMTLSGIRQVIDELPTIEPEQQWIPCSERLPDTNRDVLLQFGNSMGVGFWEHNSWGINTGDDIYSEIGEREAQPIAWRELPEPWEGEQP